MVQYVLDTSYSPMALHLTGGYDGCVGHSHIMVILIQLSTAHAGEVFQFVTSFNAPLDHLLVAT